MLITNALIILPTFYIFVEHLKQNFIQFDSTSLVALLNWIFETIAAKAVKREQ